MPLSEVINRDILDSLCEGLISLNKDFEITFFNKAAEKITGHSRNEITGMKCNEICKSELCREECPIAVALKGNKNIYDFKSKLLCNDGKTIPVRLNVSILRGKQGEVFGSVVSFIDISEHEAFSADSSDNLNYCGIIATDDKMKDIFQLIEEISDSNAPVLIHGETGTGKEMIANAIHQTSSRCNGNYVKVNCSVLPSQLLASELFGHVKGAFTDAIRDRIGRFELADKGTLFLDEITEMSLQMQAQLLRVLQEGTFERIGESGTRKVDVRVVAATNLHIEKALQTGQLRQDLMYRLNVIPIEIPPLRERKQDILLLAKEFIRQFSNIHNKNISEIADDALQLLLKHTWPGNVRELENVIEFGVIRSKRNYSVCACCLPAYLRKELNCEKQDERHHNADHEDTELIRLLVKHNWNKSKVAEIIGVNRTTIWRRLRALGVKN